MTNAAPDVLLRPREVTAALGISEATLWRRVKNGVLPRPVKFGVSSRWPQSEIAGLIESLKSKRTGAN
ncbi:MAG: hypothetical protein BGO82_05945 [Devosia sp. 67-54]|uniref:helix-turn-helix transcriptional regulator n=1 Tax=unclassified Devosia TaxID=196773 RepID=UPI00095AC27A|nr:MULTISPECIES: AlpA family phage regulatory protein [unclassified Devosia]MBN9306840.1 AlpA family phage regulatory protein [Devosia sp.]OJX17054.1 MAG: hypothetical protein BGO82_05945 [Devosia sp. 67-54]